MPCVAAVRCSGGGSSLATHDTAIVGAPAGNLTGGRSPRRTSMGNRDIDAAISSCLVSATCEHFKSGEALRMHS
eukprot:6175232-Pleurochrysis_carterae.AAC.1